MMIKKRCRAAELGADLADVVPARDVFETKEEEIA